MNDPRTSHGLFVPSAKPATVAVSAPVTAWVDPWPESSYSVAFREAIAAMESGGNYGAFNAAGQALGRYQMQPPALRDAGFLNAAQQWIGTLGVMDESAFLANPQAQEYALAELLRAKARQLAAYPYTYKYLGQKVLGKKNEFLVTESGLLAAAHRQGARLVSDYIRNLADHGWVSGWARPADQDIAKTYDRIETRLRTFERIPLWKETPWR